MPRRPKILLVQRSFIRREDDEHLIIVKRSKSNKHGRGLWEIPGGKLGKGETLAQAHQREAFEETGLLVKFVSPLVLLDTHTIGDGPFKGFSHLTIFSIARIVGGTLTLSCEHDDAAWVTYEEMLSYDLAPRVRSAATALEEFLRQSQKPPSLP